MGCPRAARQALVGCILLDASGSMLQLRVRDRPAQPAGTVGSPPPGSRRVCTSALPSVVTSRSTGAWGSTVFRGAAHGGARAARPARTIASRACTKGCPLRGTFRSGMAARKAPFLVGTGCGAAVFRRIRMTSSRSLNVCCWRADAERDQAAVVAQAEHGDRRSLGRQRAARRACLQRSPVEGCPTCRLAPKSPPEATARRWPRSHRS